MERLASVSAGASRRGSLSAWEYLSAFQRAIFFSVTALLAVSLEIHHYWFCGATFFHDACGYDASHGRFAVYASFSLSACYVQRSTERL